MQANDATRPTNRAEMLNARLLIRQSGYEICEAGELFEHGRFPSIVTVRQRERILFFLSRQVLFFDFRYNDLCRRSRNVLTILFHI